MDAGFDGDTLYIFNNKIGYFFGARTGDPVHYLIENDNYRGMFASSGELFVQTDITVSAITTTGHVVWHHHFPMQNIICGCYIP